MVSKGPAPERRVLIVEDDQGFSQMLEEIVTEKIGKPTICHDIASAQLALEGASFELVLLDNHLPDGKGYEFHQQVQRALPEAVSIMVTGIPELEQAITLTRNGLFDYLTKPVEVKDLSECLDRALLRLDAAGEHREVGELLGKSAAMREVTTQLTQAAKHPAATVLMTGESGVGKDLAARVLHQMTYSDASAPMVSLNCAAVPAEMFEAELFGAERGAYTGADRKRLGLIGAAEKGTLFLDEIGEVPLVQQAKLLRFLESREYRALGSTEVRQFSGRVVPATNKDLKQEVDEGRFREDLLYRIDVFTVRMPSLRDRLEDVPELFEGLLRQVAEKYDRALPMIKPGDMDRVVQYDFPGNVRELRNIIERSLLRSDPSSRWLTLDPRVFSTPATISVAEPAEAEEKVVATPEGLSPLEAQEFSLIRETLIKTNGGIRRAASSLGLTPQSLLRRLQKWPELREIVDGEKKA